MDILWVLPVFGAISLATSFVLAVKQINETNPVSQTRMVYGTIALLMFGSSMLVYYFAPQGGVNAVDASVIVFMTELLILDCGAWIVHFDRAYDLSSNREWMKCILSFVSWIFGFGYIIQSALGFMTDPLYGVCAVMYLIITVHTAEIVINHFFAHALQPVAS